MKKLILASTLALIIVLAGFSSAASAQSIKPNTHIQKMTRILGNVTWFPGFFIYLIVAYFVLIFMMLLFWDSYWGM